MLSTGSMSNIPNSIKKVTPLHDATWYVKWFGVCFICLAVLCRSIQEVPKIYDVCFSIIGTGAWLWVGFNGMTEH